MNYSPRQYDTGDEPSDPNYDRTLRALEGRQIQDMLQMTSPTSARHEGREADDGGDVFLRIAREEGARRAANEIGQDETQSSVVSLKISPCLHTFVSASNTWFAMCSSHGGVVFFLFFFSYSLIFTFASVSFSFKRRRKKENYFPLT